MRVVDHQRSSVFDFEMIFVLTTRGYNAIMSDDCLIMMSSSSCQTMTINRDNDIDVASIFIFSDDKKRGRVI